MKGNAMKPVKFVPNTSDELHCLQACLMSAFLYFHPNEPLTFAELDDLTGFEPEKLTWPMKAYYEVINRGFDVVIFDPMDFNLFVSDTTKYMEEEFGVETAEKFYRESNVPEAVNITRKLLKDKNLKFEQRVPSFDDLRQLIENDYLCICHVNQDVIRNNEGYGAHSILVLGIEGDVLIAHNPGPPPVAFQRLDRAFFEKAWASPNDSVKTIFALRNSSHEITHR